MRNILSLNEVLDETYDIYRKNMKSFIGYTALMMMISGTIMYGIMIVVGIVFVLVGVLIFGMSGFDSSGGWAMIVLIYVGVLLVMIPASSVMQMVAAGPVQAIQAVGRDEKVSFGAMFGFSFKNIFYIVTSTLGIYLLLGGIALGVGGIYAALFFTILSWAGLVSKIVVGAVFGILLIIAWVWISIKGAFYLPVAICEKKHFMKAVMGSFELTKGQFKHIFWIVFSYGISFLVVYMSLGGLASLAGNFMTLFMSDESGAGVIIGFFILQMLAFVVQMAVSIFLMPLQYLTIPLVYFNERNRKYGDDLHVAADRLLVHARQVQNREVI